MQNQINHTFSVVEAVEPYITDGGFNKERPVVCVVNEIGHTYFIGYRYQRAQAEAYMKQLKPWTRSPGFARCVQNGRVIG